MELYDAEPLKNYLELKKLVEFYKSKEPYHYYVKKFYNNIHNKGLKLIENKEMNLIQIIEFIQKYDIFYYSQEYEKDRDPKIFKDIQITDIDKNYKENIKILKDNRIWSIFVNSKKEKEFYKIFLEQVKKVKDFAFIFELFSIKDINKKFACLIKVKIEEIFLFLLDEKEEDFNILFEILKNILIIEYKNDIDLTNVELNYHFTSKFYFFLLNNKKDEVIKIINNLQNKILNFFIEQHRGGNGNEESIISLLLCSPNREFTLILLNEMENKDYVMEEYNDFYQKSENKKYTLFKHFIEKCKDLIKDKTLSEGKYLKESILLKNKILKDLEERNLIFNIIDNLIDEENLFYKKIIVIADGDVNYGKKIYNKIKEDLENCYNKFGKIELIEKYYRTFLGKEKKEIIEKIGEKLKELKNKNLNEIVSIPENTIIENKQFNFEESIKESKKIKYNDSFFFYVYI